LKFTALLELGAWLHVNCERDSLNSAHIAASE